MPSCKSSNPYFSKNSSHKVFFFVYISYSLFIIIQLLLFTRSHVTEEANHREIELIKAHYDGLILQKDSQFRKKQTEIENECKKKLVKLMHETFDQIQEAQNNSQIEKDIMTNSYQEEKSKDETIIIELERRIKRLEKHAALTLKSIGERNNKHFFLLFVLYFFI